MISHSFLIVINFTFISKKWKESESITLKSNIFRNPLLIYNIPAYFTNFKDRLLGEKFRLFVI